MDTSKVHLKFAFNLMETHFLCFFPPYSFTSKNSKWPWKLQFKGQSNHKLLTQKFDALGKEQIMCILTELQAGRVALPAYREPTGNGSEILPIGFHYLIFIVIFRFCIIMQPMWNNVFFIFFVLKIKIKKFHTKPSFLTILNSPHFSLCLKFGFFRHGDPRREALNVYAENALLFQRDSKTHTPAQPTRHPKEHTICVLHQEPQASLTPVLGANRWKCSGVHTLTHAHTHTVALIVLHSLLTGTDTFACRGIWLRVKSGYGHPKWGDMENKKHCQGVFLGSGWSFGFISSLLVDILSSASEALSGTARLRRIKLGFKYSPRSPNNMFFMSGCWNLDWWKVFLPFFKMVWGSNIYLTTGSIASSASFTTKIKNADIFWACTVLEGDGDTEKKRQRF